MNSSQTPADDRLDRVVLPNGRKISCVEPGGAVQQYREIYVDGAYRYERLALPAGAVIFDVGANIGITSLYFHEIQPTATIYAFEPAAAPYRALRANFTAAGITGDVVRAAVTNETGAARLGYYPLMPTMSGLDANSERDARITQEFLEHSGLAPEQAADLIRGRHEIEWQDCATVTMSDYLHAAAVPHIDLLKIDVERSEMQVLRGIEPDDWPRIDQVYAEVHDFDENLQEFVKTLNERGFETHVWQEDSLRGSEMHMVYGRHQAGEVVGLHSL